jgi:DinB superfamily
MYDLHRDLIDALTVTPETLAGLLGGVSQAQARAARGGDEDWSVVEVLCHLRDAEEISFGRMKAMRDQDDPQIIGYDQEALARERKYNEADVASALAAFTHIRAGHVAALLALKPEEWERTGQHNEIGAITIFAHSIHKASHDAIHCAQIARQLLSFKKG